MKRIYRVNDCFFSNIDTEEKAYILGLIYSDGNINASKQYNSYALNFGQMERDLDIVLKIKDAMGANNHIIESKNKFNDNIFYSLSIHSKQIYDDLVRLGVAENKSLIIEFNEKIVPDFLLHHFIRGLFDGDGCVWNGKRKKMIVKDSSRKTGYRERIVHNVKFTYTGNTNFVNELQNTLCRLLGLKKTKLNYTITDKSRRNLKRVCTMEYCGRKNIKQLYEYLYHDATIFGKRKKEKFEEILNYYEDSSI